MLCVLSISVKSRPTCLGVFQAHVLKDCGSFNVKDEEEYDGNRIQRLTYKELNLKELLQHQ